ncbi:hypothetical protein GFK26_09810 [Variovorax paradoxus]|uniref:Terpene synthase n=1 Tax=Variovorax paradoxus TaxID=34073 RepID=A0A5Q0M0V3_VARPD|nr:hypothetical protein [Variovorax paradoxus]QFZ83039.1 hypothetical protein GFK26_09810 [Variovorax paradoxus]
MKLPYFECPIPSAIHPEAAHADAQSVAWMRRFALCIDDTERERMARSGCGELAARIVPDATAQTLQILSDFFIWNVSFDDEYCDEGPLSRQPGRLAGTLAMIHRAIETPEDGAQFKDRYAAAMCDIRRRLQTHASADQMAQWLAAMKGWFFAETWKAGNVATGHVPSLDDYALLRLYSGGGLAFPTLAAIAQGYAVPVDMLEDRRVKALTEMALTLATWSADIVSYEKEVAREQGAHNLVSVIQHEDQCTPALAAARAVAMYMEIMQLFLSLRTELLTHPSPALQRHLQCLGHIVRATFDWCHGSERYVQEAAPAEAPSETPAAAHAASPRTARTISSIAWWWVHDPAPRDVRRGVEPAVRAPATAGALP